MYCRNCGTKNNKRNERCCSCGAYLHDVVVMNNQTGKRCPKCGEYNCQSFSDTISSGKTYGAGKGCCGYLLFGPWGLLCGLCGNGIETRTKHYWVCPNCNKKFRA